MGEGWVTLAKRHGIRSPNSIRKRAANEGWSRNGVMAGGLGQDEPRVAPPLEQKGRHPVLSPEVEARLGALRPQDLETAQIHETLVELRAGEELIEVGRNALALLQNAITDENADVASAAYRRMLTTATNGGLPRMVSVITRLIVGGIQIKRLALGMDGGSPDEEEGGISNEISNMLAAMGLAELRELRAKVPSTITATVVKKGR